MSYIENDLAKFSTLGKVCLVGDFNARTNNLNDFIPHDNGDDIENFDYTTDKNIITRNSLDMGPVCMRGRKLLDLCISSRL